MQTDAVFWIASPSKPMTATAAMMPVDEGRIALDDPVEKCLSEFRGQMVVAEKDDDHVLLRNGVRVTVLPMTKVFDSVNGRKAWWIIRGTENLSLVVGGRRLWVRAAGGTGLSYRLDDAKDAVNVDIQQVAGKATIRLPANTVYLVLQ